MIPDVLQHFDLPQVAAAVVDRRLVLLDLVDATKSRLDADLARKAYEWTTQAYAKGIRPERFVVAKRRQEIALAEEYLELLGIGGVEPASQCWGRYSRNRAATGRDGCSQETP